MFPWYIPQKIPEPLTLSPTPSGFPRGRTTLQPCPAANAACKLALSQSVLLCLMIEGSGASLAQEGVASCMQDHPVSNVWTVGAPYIILYYIVSRFLWPRMSSTMCFSLAPWDIWPFLWCGLHARHVSLSPVCRKLGWAETCPGTDTGTHPWQLRFANCA